MKLSLKSNTRFTVKLNTSVYEVPKGSESAWELRSKHSYSKGPVPSCETYIGCEDDDDSCADFGIEASLRQATGTREGRNVNEEQTTVLINSYFIVRKSRVNGPRVAMCNSFWLSNSVWA